MSVTYKTYVMYGCRFKYKDLTDIQGELLNSIRDIEYDGLHHDNRIVAIIDVMSGNYVMVGQIIAISDTAGQFSYEVELSAHELHYKNARLQSWIEAHTGFIKEIKYIVFTHYT